MGLLGGNNEEKKEQKAKAIMQKYGLENLSDPRDIQAVKNIANDLAGNKMIELGAIFNGSGVDAAKLSYMNAIMQQNFIIIRLLDKIANK